MSGPRVSIVTTVYDRVLHLDRCLRAMRHSVYQDFEQIVVSDSPPALTLTAVQQLVARGGPKVRYLNHAPRANDWGMTPAWDGVRAAQGEFVCFLSDDNAYLPDHLGPLVAALEADPELGFAYSSCQYAGRLVLNVAPPAPSRIDLGQPLFRRSVLLETFPAGLPFHEFAWDWRMIAALMAKGVRWQHHDAPTFIFRLASYPKLVGALA